MRKPAILLTLLPLLLGAAAAQAATLTVDVIAADWTNIVMTPLGSTNFTQLNNDGIPGGEYLEWGLENNATDERSSYNFDSAAPPSFSISLDTPFSLGDFIHKNRTLFSFGGALSSAVLNITADLTVDGTPVTGGPFTFSFLHSETNNPLGDDVTFTPLAAESTFVVGGVTYEFEALGFYKDGSPISGWDTPEGTNNTAQLMAQLEAEVVPEPGTLVLLGTGLLSLVGFGRRRVRRGREA